MIILDTNVISEPLKRNGAPQVRLWLDEQVADTLFITSINLSELLLGVEFLPDGQRKKNLRYALDELVDKLFKARILAFDDEAAIAYARLVASAKLKGKTVTVADGQIAAIAHVHGFTVATRDSEHFLAMGISVIDPWQAPA